MGKLNVNSRVHKFSIAGLVESHDTKIDQAVLSGSNVTFNSIDVTSDVTIGGNLTVNGNTTIISTDVVEMKDNIILINSEETGTGVTSVLSGLEVERGTLTNQQVVFSETNDNWRIGEVGATRVVAVREDSPLINGIMTWDNTSKILKSSNQIDIDIIFNGSNPTSKSTGGIRMTGGIGIQQDAYIGGSLYLEGTSPNHASLSSDAVNNLLISSGADINITPGTGGDVNIPANTGMTFSNDSYKIESNGSDLSVTSGGDINLSAVNAINIPENVSITFGDNGEKIEGDGTDLTITSSNLLNINTVELDVQASGLVKIDTTDTINGIKIGTEGAPVTIGHTTSETKIGDNLTVDGELLLNDNQVIDNTSTEALIVRKDGDSGDIFVVDTTNSVVDVTGNITVSGTVDGRDIANDGSTLDNLNTTIGLSALTSVEVDQLENINSTTISETQWGYLGSSDQGIATSDSVSFSGLIVEGEQIIDKTSTEALLVRKDGDSGDIFAVDTTNSIVGVTGNITVSGTVDGRDIATDGSNLDNLNTTIGLSALTSAEVDQL
jgi:hypothetical protein